MLKISILDISLKITKITAASHRGQWCFHGSGCLGTDYLYVYVIPHAQEFNVFFAQTSQLLIVGLNSLFIHYDIVTWNPFSHYWRNPLGTDEWWPVFIMNI